MNDLSFTTNTDYSDEDIVYIASYSKNVNELSQAIAFTLMKNDELETMPRSQSNNQRRKFYAFTYGRLQKRLNWLTDNQKKLNEKKKLRRHEAKAREEVVLKSLLTRIINARGNTTNHPSPVEQVLNAGFGKPVNTGDKIADNSLNNIRAMALEAQAKGEPVDWKQIASVYKAVEASKKVKDIVGAFEPDENGEVEL